MLEIKHRLEQVVLLRTRGQITGIPCDGDSKVLLAKAGIKPPMFDKSLHNDYMLDLFLNRVPGQVVEQSQLISTRQQFHDEADLVSIIINKRVNLEFDFKREPINPRMENCHGTPHLAFDTRPWAKASDGLLARAIFEIWRKTNCLKTLDDYDNWLKYYAEQQFVKSQGTSIKVLKDGLPGVLKRLFFYAYTNQKWGCKKLMKNPEVAKWLTDAGYTTKSDALKNAKRAKVIQSVLPAAPDVLDLWRVLLDQQPNLQAKYFFTPDQLPIVAEQISSVSNRTLDLTL